MKIYDLYKEILNNADIISIYFIKYIILYYPSDIKKENIDKYNGKYKEYNGKDFEMKYQEWYTKCLIVLSIIAPERKQEFINYYEPNSKRKNFDATNYTIKDSIHLIFNSHIRPLNALSLLNSQISIIKSCESVVKEKLYNIKSLIENEVFESELESANYLLKKRV